jgi:hypothetical protein
MQNYNLQADCMGLKLGLSPYGKKTERVKELRAEGGIWRWQEAGDRCIMEELHDLPSLPNIPPNVMKWGIRWVRHVARKGTHEECVGNFG